MLLTSLTYVLVYLCVEQEESAELFCFPLTILKEVLSECSWMWREKAGVLLYVEACPLLTLRADEEINMNSPSETYNNSI